MKTEKMSFSTRYPKFKGTFFIYGQYLDKADVLRINDFLFEEMNTENKYRVIDFPLVRKIPYKEDHFHIIIKPEFIIDSLDDHSRTLKERILCKQLDEAQDIS
ncbi:hypothetical protein [Gorillibacterium massiliense]|uniref:hypothetical protein n=1 Tax=Gorillibacterium massiliense TaxID=1280390 RepID=UPI0005930A58|nr:hypothetical protein [Gorillibacterium massiliense]